MDIEEADNVAREGVHVNEGSRTKGSSSPTFFSKSLLRNTECGLFAWCPVWDNPRAHLRINVRVRICCLMFNIRTSDRREWLRDDRDGGRSSCKRSVSRGWNLVGTETHGNSARGLQRSPGRVRVGTFNSQVVLSALDLVFPFLSFVCLQCCC